MSNEIKIEVLHFYCDRPHSIDTVFKSIQNACKKHDNISISVIDDSAISDNNFKLNAEKSSSFQNLNNKVKIFEVGCSIAKKIEIGDSIFGKKANEALEDSNADIVFMLCDDDAVHKNYFYELNNFYIKENDCKYSYAHIIPVYGVIDDNIFECKKFNLSHKLNKNTKDINPQNRVDASQVSWRLKDWKKSGIKFPYPQTANLDSKIYGSMFKHWGSCRFNKLISQYKSFNKYQLGHRQNSKKIEERFLDSRYIF